MQSLERIGLVGLTLIGIVATAASGGGITVLPGTTVHVGQEVVFDGNSVKVPGAKLMANGMIQGRYEWDFGDTYTQKWYDHFPTSQQGGSPTTHFFVRPGTFHVTLTVTDTNAPPDTNTAGVDVTVTGDWPKLPPLPAAPETLWLKFDSNLADSSGNGLDATCEGGDVAYAAGAEANGVTVGSGKYLRVADHDLLGGMSGLTISVWARKNAKKDSGYLVYKENAYYIWLKDNETIWAGVYTTAGAGLNTAYNLGILQNTMWHHYALVYDGSRIHLYLDGQDIDPTPAEITGAVADTATPLRIGHTFTGTIDEVKIFSAALTQDDLTRRFELRHAPFHARTKQYVYTVIPGRYSSAPTNRIEAIVTGGASGSTTLLDKAELSCEERFLVNNTALPADDYTLTARLKNPDGAVLDTATEYFSKSYAGAPTVGIDENNSVVYRGALFFPVTCFGLRQDLMAVWSPRHVINTIYNAGTTTPQTVAAWQAYMRVAARYGWASMGSGGWFIGTVSPYGRNVDLSWIAANVNATKEDANNLMYQLGDEPDIGAESGHIPGPVLRAMTYKAHMLDPHHPTATNFAGIYLTPGSTGEYRANEYSMMSNATYFGGKGAAPTDVIGMDYYPVDWASRGAKVRDYPAILDRLRDRNYGLVPYMAFVETQDIAEGQGTPIVTPAQIRMLAWLGVVHGCKGINWFHYFNPIVPPDNNFKAMAQFLTDITALKDIVLGPAVDQPVADSANETGCRVDTLVREHGGCLYVFAVRVAEVDEPNAISVTFTISELPNRRLGTTATVYGEGRTIPMTNTDFRDEFAQDAVHIYQIPQEQAQ
jgi:PKD repeat protein